MPRLKGCNRNGNAWYRELKKDILGKLDPIDKHCELYGLTAVDRQEQMELRPNWTKCCYKKRLNRNKELKWKNS